MFCKNCGTEINEGTVFCSNCGAKIENVDIPVETSVNLQKKKNNKTIGMVVSVLVAVAVIIGLGSLVKTIFFADNYEDVACKYTLAELNFDYNNANKYTILDEVKISNDYWENYCESNDTSMSEMFEDFEDETGITVKNLNGIFDYFKENRNEYLEDRYGDYTVSVKVVDSNELTRRELSDEIDDIIDDFEYCVDDEFDFDDYIDENKIKKGYEVEVKITIDGEDDYDSDTETLTVVKYKGKWKILTIDLLDSLM